MSQITTPQRGRMLLALICLGVLGAAAAGRAQGTSAPAVAAAAAPTPGLVARRDALRLPPGRPAGPALAPAGVPPAAPATCGVQAPWQYGPSRTAVRGVWGSAAAVGPDGAFYVAGGMDVHYEPYPAVARFNPASNTWEALASLPLAVGQSQGAWAGNVFYVPGGYQPGGGVTNALQVYHLNTNSWSAAAPYPRAGGIEAVAAAGLGGKLYVIGGDDGAALPHPFASTYIYDPATNSWTSGAPLPAARTGAAATAANGRIYLFGGTDANQNALDSLLVYDPVANSWTPLAAANSGGLGNFPGLSPYGPGAGPAAPSASQSAAPATTGKLIAVFGGSTSFAPSTATGIYNIATNSWSPGPALLAPRLGPAQGTLPSGLVVVYGGFSGTGNVQQTSEQLPPVVPCATATPTITRTPQPPTATSTPGPPTATPTPCGGFSDVHPADYFYTPVQYLVAHGVISGYGDCTFRPYNATTRSQMVKIVVLGFTIPITTPSSGYTFHDVPPAFPFFAVIETAAAHTIVSGYQCGGPGEPCDALGRPYFRPYANVTRGQLAKIVVVGAGWTLVQPPAATFADVAPGSAFYPFVESASCHGVISGYACGGPGEPCDPAPRPYFRPYAAATRGQIAKIAYGALTSNQACATPTVTPTVTPTP